MAKNNERSTEPKSRGGWLRLYRKLRKHPRYKDSEYLHIFVHFLLNVEFQSREAIFNGKSITLKAGQMITSRGEIAELLGIREGTVKRKLDDLRSDQQIKWRAGNKHSLFTVLNWSKYQRDDRQNDQPEDRQNDRQTISQRSASDQPAISKMRNRQAGMRKTRAKKPRSLQENWGDGAGGKDGATEGATGTETHSLIPKFAPLRAGLFLSELEKLRDAATAEITRIRDTKNILLLPDNLTSLAVEDLKFLAEKATKEPETAGQCEREAEAVKANPKSYLRHPLKEEAAMAVKAWRERIVDIEAAMSGRETNEKEKTLGSIG